MYKIVLGSVVVMGMTGAAFAQETPVQMTPVLYNSTGVYTDSEGSGAIPSMPVEVMTVGGIRYVTGGIGDEEMTELKSLSQDFNVQLLMVGTGGAYISNAMVRVIDADGEEVLPMIKGAGPYLYLSLNPGKYTVEVTAPQGGIKTATVNAPASGAAKPIMRFADPALVKK